MFKSIISAQPAFQPLPAATIPGFDARQDFKSRILILTDTSSRRNLVNEARMGFSRLQGVVVPENRIPLSAIGIPQIAVMGAFSMAYSVNADQTDNGSRVTQLGKSFFSLVGGIPFSLVGAPVSAVFILKDYDVAN